MEELPVLELVSVITEETKESKTKRVILKADLSE
jgi:hypothetical protein